jgi:serine/threonine-protein kinase
MAAQDTDIVLGEVLDEKYQVLRLLGSGGMGAVYAARRVKLGDVVAIKCILPAQNNEVNRTRFLREAQAAARIRHPNVVQVFDFGAPYGRTPYMVMEYLEGPTLAELGSRPSLERALAIFGRICAAVEAGHRRGVVHRDLKPGNVMLARSDDGREVVKVLDFGLARFADAPDDVRVTTPGAMLGTVAYMAPEQVARGAATPASDVFALAVMLYELVTGELPFAGDNHIATLLKITSGEYAAPTVHVAELPSAVVAAIEAGLAVDPTRRPHSPEALAALAGAAIGDPMAIAPGEPSGVTPILASDSARTDPALVEANRHLTAAARPPSRPPGGPNEAAFVGRAEELAAIEREIEAAFAGASRIVVVLGEAGLGKSRVLDELGARFRERAAVVLRGQCFAYEGDQPPPLETFEWMLAKSDVAEPTVGMQPGARGIEGGEKWQRFAALGRALSARADGHPLVVRVDDLQWASSLDLEFLAYLSHATQSEPVVILATARPGAAELERWIAGLVAQRAVVTVPLAAWRTDELRAWLQAAFGGLRIRPQDLRRLQHATAGNPFAVVELVRRLLAEGTIRWTDGGWACADLYAVALPDSVHTLLRARFDNLPAAVREALEVACVVGEQFRFETVLAAGELDERALEDALDDAVARKLLSDRELAPGSDYRFASTNLRTVLYESLGGRRRRRLHMRVVEALRKLYAGDEDRMAGIVAHHLHAIGDWAQALPFALRACEERIALHDSDRAETSLEQAREAIEHLVSSSEPPSALERARYERLQGAFDCIIGRLEAAELGLRRAVAAAQAAGDDSLTLDALLDLAETQLGRGQFEAGAATGHSAIELAERLGDGRRELLARIRVAGCAGPLGRLGEAQAVLAPALSDAAAGWPAQRALALRELAWVLAKRGEFAAAEQAGRDALANAREARDALAEYRAVSVLGLVHAECGDFAASIPRLEDALQLARALSLRRREGIELCNLGECRYLLGDAERGLACVRQGLDIFVEIGDRASEGDCRVNIGRMLLALHSASASSSGRVRDLEPSSRPRSRLELRDDAIAMLEAGRELCAASGRAEYEGIALCELAEVRATEGQPMLARALFDRARAVFERIAAAQLWRAEFGAARMSSALGDLTASIALARSAHARIERQLAELPGHVSPTALERARAEIEVFLRERGRAATPALPRTLAEDGEERTADALARQHVELTSLGAAVIAQLDPARVAADPAPAMRAFGLFVRRLELHARTESEVLYPKLLAHPDENVRAQASALYAEGLGIYDDVFALQRRWTDEAVVRTSPERFVGEVAELLKRLGRRMRREDLELHPLADR